MERHRNAIQLGAVSLLKVATKLREIAKKILLKAHISAFTLKYVVKHKSAKLLMTYTVGKLEAAFNITHLI